MVLILTNGRAKLLRTIPGLTFCAETTHAIYHWMDSTRPTCAMLFPQPDLNAAKATQTEIAFLCEDTFKNKLIYINDK